MRPTNSAQLWWLFRNIMIITIINCINEAWKTRTGRSYGCKCVFLSLSLLVLVMRPFASVYFDSSRIVYFGMRHIGVYSYCAFSLWFLWALLYVRIQFLCYASSWQTFLRDTLLAHFVRQKYVTVCSLKYSLRHIGLALLSVKVFLQYNKAVWSWFVHI